jgi:hypothetical protein
MNEDIKALQRELIEGMTSYMTREDVDEDDDDADDDFDPGYSQVHVDRCREILDVFFEELQAIPGEDRNAEIMEVVQSVVTELNELNDETEGGLIETDQREQLCEIIILAAKEAGLVTDVYDITEEWRDW